MAFIWLIHAVTAAPDPPFDRSDVAANSFAIKATDTYPIRLACDCRVWLVLALN
jgi:hypothetical protein